MVTPQKNLVNDIESYDKINFVFNKGNNYIEALPSSKWRLSVGCEISPVLFYLHIVSIHTKGIITLDVTPPHSSVEILVVSRMATRDHHVVPLYSPTPKCGIMQSFSVWGPGFGHQGDLTSHNLIFNFGLCKELFLYGKRLRPESLESMNIRSSRADNKRYTAACMTK
jgi:hypothetical protein